MADCPIILYKILLWPECWRETAVIGKSLLELPHPFVAFLENQLNHCIRVLPLCYNPFTEPLFTCSASDTISSQGKFLFQLRVHFVERAIDYCAAKFPVRMTLEYFHEIGEQGTSKHLSIRPVVPML